MNARITTDEGMVFEGRVISLSTDETAVHFDLYTVRDGYVTGCCDRNLATVETWPSVTPET